MMRRLATGGRIDRQHVLTFSFDGNAYTGHPGDTLASALLANGVHLMGRSFKYHRPRGPIAAGAEEPNALVTIGTGGRATPNLRATQVELHDGLVAASQNRFPSLAFDTGSLAGVFAPLLAAGFYYKTFMAPGRAWHRIYEPLIRGAAGLGRVPALPDLDIYTQRYAHCDVLVVGAGAAGLAAALAASADGAARVMLVDEQSECGGGLLAEATARLDGAPAADWLAAALATLRARANVQILTRTTAFGYFAQNFLGLCELLTDHLGAKPPGLARERLWKLRAGKVILATGATERPLVFAGNDRPGVMLAGAARAYCTRWAVQPGTRALVFTADDSGYAAARDLAAAGVRIAAVADLRENPGCDSFGLPVRPATAVVATTGHLRIATADLAPLRGGSLERVACDLLLMAGGWTPSLNLFSQSRGRVAFDADRIMYLPGEPAQNQICAGSCRGVFGLAACLADGATAGGGMSGAVVVTDEIIPSGGFQGLVPRSSARHAFVDFQNDVKASDIQLAVREGFRSIEHIKRYTTTGMATDQGRTSNINALAIAAAARDVAMPTLGLTTFRMPATPITFGSFAGHSRGALFDPVRHTPMHAPAASLGAVFEDVGQWKRALCFPRPGETHAQAVARECRAVRACAGMFDASTLGKIELVGRDALAFLNRIYANDLSTLHSGKCRYALMLNEAGFIMDDGVVARLAADRFHITTTTGGAAHVLHHMEDYLQTEFSDLRCWPVSVTEHFAVLAVQGPRARDIIAPMVEGLDLDAFPHMSVAQCRIAGLPARLFRVSFTGEAGFEINVPAGHGAALWDTVLNAGAAHGMQPYGTEAMHVLRAEKGYVVVGQDTDGTVIPDDLGMGKMVGRGKGDFVGRRSLGLPDLAAADRPQLVGLLTADASVVLEEGAQIIAASATSGRRADGHVTSSYASPTLGRSIAMAMLVGGRARMGETVRIAAPIGALAATIVPTVFYDPAGGRLHA